MKSSILKLHCPPDRENFTQIGNLGIFPPPVSVIEPLGKVIRAVSNTIPNSLNPHESRKSILSAIHNTTAKKRLNRIPSIPDGQHPKT